MHACVFFCLLIKSKQNKRNGYSGPLLAVMQSHGSTLSLPTNMPAVFLKEITLDFATERKLGG